MKTFRFFFSMATTGILLVAFALVIAIATFVENDHGTAAAKLLIYNAWWFEALLLAVAINLLGSILVNKLWSKPKWPVAFFHLAFLVILAGAAITRYTSYEGTMHIREGEMNNKILSRNTFIHIEAERSGSLSSLTRDVVFLPGMKPKFSEIMTIGEQTIEIKSVEYITSALETPVATEGGVPIVSLFTVDGQNKPVEIVLKKGQYRTIGNIKFRFSETSDSSSLSIILQGNQLSFFYRDTVFRMSMAEEKTERLSPDTLHPFLEKAIYQAGDVGFVLKKFYPSARMELVQDPTGQQKDLGDALKLQVSEGEIQKEVVVLGKPGTAGEPSSVEINGTTLNFQYGSLVHELPFALYLKDFQLERYPGSNSPSSFASEVVLLDEANRIERPYRIFMNNILKYNGYRFFQSSYDPDEQGTVLSVNYDAPGTAVTYAGYLLMTLGMLLTFFFKNSRFRKLTASLKQLKSQRKTLITGVAGLLLLISVIPARAQDSLTAIIPAEHARKFGELQVQNVDGRIEPLNTLASELLRKISKQNSYQQQSPLQVMLSMMANPEKWQSEPLVKVGNADIQKVLGIKGSHASFQDFIDPEQPNGYKLTNLVKQAYDKSPAQRNKFDKEIINVDERINILYKMINMGFLSIFPVPDDSNHTWVTHAEAHSHPDRNLAVFATTSLREYTSALKEGIASGNMSQADEALQKIAQYQQDQGAEVYPSSMKTRLEIFYVNFNLFKKLALIYMLLGLILLGLQFASLLSAKSHPDRLNKAGFWAVLALFAVHTAGLGIRWYISDHAPWSNGYETLLYISWSACLAGLFFARRSPMTLAVTTVLASISLLVAGMSWMSPELTNLVPVLKSYWLIIHVAVITASYGFLGMGALLAIVNLVLMIVRNTHNSNAVSLTIRELSYIIALALIAGLYMLTIGSFLGGVWANESWGRYWGWDPKETWAMVTILVYAFITHMHRIKGLGGEFAFSTASLLGFGSVLMTYFGVNYYLSGLHSYAAGDPPPVPAGVYIGVVIVIILIALAWMADRQWKKAH